MMKVWLMMRNEWMMIDEERFKSKGTIELHIDHFSEFAKTENAQHISEAVYIRGIPWKIKASTKKRQNDRDRLGLSFFVICIGDPLCTTWSCKAYADLKVKSRKDGVDDKLRDIKHTFNAEDSTWGFPQYSSCRVLLGKHNGYIKNDTVILSVDVNADAVQVNKLEVVVNPLKRMLKDGLNSDVQLVCGGETISAHKVILSAHSPVFSSMFAQMGSPKRVSFALRTQSQRRFAPFSTSSTVVR